MGTRRLTVALDPARHDREGFSSGVEAVDNFLKKTANKLSRADNLRTFVFADRQAQLIGYYAINAFAIDHAELPARFARNRPGHGKIPAAFISMIGIDKRFQGQGYGSALLVDCLARIADAADLMGIAVVLLDILDCGNPASVERRRHLYTDFGFLPFHGDPLRMYLPLAEVRRRLEALDTTHG